MSVLTNWINRSVAKMIRRILEIPIEQQVVEDAKELLGLRSLKLISRYDAGWPDRLWLLDKGRVFWTEFKAPGYEVIEGSLQWRRHAYLRSLGHDVATFDNHDAAMLALEERV